MKCAQFGWLFILSAGCISTGAIDDRKDGLTDVDNDGLNDVQLGAYQDDDGGTDAGSTHLILTGG
jgi:hypothetical protein